jgi:hypothetical protein
MERLVGDACFDSGHSCPALSILAMRGVRVEVILLATVQNDREFPRFDGGLLRRKSAPTKREILAEVEISAAQFKRDLDLIRERLDAPLRSIPLRALPLLLQRRKPAGLVVLEPEFPDPVRCVNLRVRVVARSGEQHFQYRGILFPIAGFVGVWFGTMFQAPLGCLRGIA